MDDDKRSSDDVTTSRDPFDDQSSCSSSSSVVCSDVLVELSGSGNKSNSNVKAKTVIKVHEPTATTSNQTTKKPSKEVREFHGFVKILLWCL